MAAIIMTRAQHPKGLQEGLNALFGFRYNEIMEQWPTLFEKSTTKKAFEEDVLRWGLGPATEKSEGAPVQYKSGGEGWSYVYKVITMALAFGITEEAMEDELYATLAKDFAGSMAESFKSAKEIKAMEIINNMTDGTNYALGDGVSLANTAHPLAYGGTFANTFTIQADVSEEAIEDALNTIALWNNQVGIPMQAKVVKAYTNPTQEFNFARVLRTQGRPGTADNDINAIKTLGVVPEGVQPLHYLTDTDAWFLKTDVKNGFKYLERLGMQTKTESDFETGNVRYKGRERYVFGITDPHCGFFSSGA
jgi:hypothetical protein